MRSLMICLTILFAINTIGIAQSHFIFNEIGLLQPFSISLPYIENIQPENLKPHYETDSYDNDSLLWEYNDPDSIMIKPDIKAGFTIDSVGYSFKQMATRFDLGHGFLWLLKISSPTSAGIAVYFEKFNLPEGVGFGSYRIHQTGVFTSVPKMYNKDNFVDFRFRSKADGRELYIELYEPKSNSKETFDIYIERISYYFTDGRRVAMPEPPKK